MGKSTIIETELAELAAAGVLDEAACERVRVHYRSKAGNDRKTNPLTAILSVLGAVLVCAGIVLLVAYNWYGLGRSLKTAAAFLLVIAPGAAGIALFALRERPRAGAVETAALFHSILFGAAVALIGQIYQLPENFGAFLGAYFASAIAIAYLYRALSAAAVAAVLAQILCAYMVNAEQWPRLAHLAAALAVLPLAFIFRAQKSPLRAGWTFKLSMAGVFAAAIFLIVYNAADAWLATLCALAAFSGSGGRLLETLHEKAGKEIGLWGRSLGACVCFIASLRIMWLHGGHMETSAESAALIALLAIPAALAAAYQVYRDKRADSLVDALPLALALIASVRIPISLLSVAALCVVAYAVFGFRDGWRSRSIKKLNEAFILSLAFVVARFFDMTDSILYRGVVFILGGVSVFAFNRFVSIKWRRSAADKEAGDAS